MSQHPSAEPAFDYAHIRDQKDRSYSLALVARLASPETPEDERDTVAGILDGLSDWRVAEPLYQLLEDPLQMEPARRLAGWVLRNMSMIDRERARTYFFSADPVLQRQGLFALGPEDGSLVESIASQPEHPLHLWSIVRMDFGFECKRHQDLKIKALSHPNPDVREAAADVLLWDEPVAAEEALLQAALDPVAEVAIAALQTLEYHPSVRCIQSIYRLVDRDDDVGKQAQSTLEDIRNSIAISLNRPEPQRGRLLGWARPVWEILAFAPEEIEPEEPEPEEPEPEEPEPGEPSQSKRENISAKELMGLLQDPNGCWQKKLDLFYQADPDFIVGSDRERLSEFILEHPDYTVRDYGGRLLAAWNDHRRLLRLTSDRHFLVVKAACYWLGLTSPNPEVASFAKEHLNCPGVCDTHARGTLKTYAVHAPKEDVIVLCENLAQNDERESVRTTAVEELIKLGARESIERLLFLLQKPPVVTWAVHLRLLKECRKLGIAPLGLEALRSVDNLHVQEAVGWFD